MEGHVACGLKQGLRGVPRDASCDLVIRKRETQEIIGFCFEDFDGTNSTWSVAARLEFVARPPPR